MSNREDDHSFALAMIWGILVGIMFAAVSIAMDIRKIQEGIGD